MPVVKKQNVNRLPPVENHAKTSPEDDVWGMVETARMLVYGESGCLSGDTFISYQIRNKEGKMQNCKGGSLDHLYRRFHGLWTGGKGYYQRPQTKGSDYYVASVTDDGRIVRNLVTDVLDSGTKQVFEVVTENGFKIKATANHPFMVEDGYKELRRLIVGEEILVSPGKRLKRLNKIKRPHRPEVMVKYHPGQRVKIVEGYTYYRLTRSRLVYEANYNGMTPEDYRHVLNTASKEEIDNLWTVPEGAEIHHIDENPLNDKPSNLILAETSTEHQKKFHASTSLLRPGMSIYVVKDKIASITRLGTERVYDIKVADPFRNFVASGFAVHNSGKTTFAATFPGPILWLICSGGSKPGELRSINTSEYRKKITPRIITGSDQINYHLDHECKSGQFQTVVLDHASGLADLKLKEILGLDELPAQKGWGMATQSQYGQQALQLKETFRALLNLPGNVVIIAQQRTFGEESNSDVIKPVVGASLSPGVVSWLNPACDFVVQTYKRARLETITTEIAGKPVQTTKRGEGVEYCLRTGQHEVYTSKVRTPKRGLPECIVDPTYEKFFALLD